MFGAILDGIFQRSAIKYKIKQVNKLFVQPYLHFIGICYTTASIRGTISEEQSLTVLVTSYILNPDLPTNFS